MTKFKIGLLAAAGSMILAASPATATTYLLNIDIGAGNVNGSITTDNTIGTLTSANVTDWTLNLNDGVNMFTLDGMTNSALGVFGTDLSASATALSFNFGGSGLALFQNPSIGSSGPFFCLTNDGCFGESGPAFGVGGMNASFDFQESLQTGSVEFAFAGAGGIPEPTTWAMLIFGFGAIGAGMRRKAKVATKVSYA